MRSKKHPTGDSTACIKTLLRDDCLYRCIESLQDVYPDIRISVADDGKHTGDKTRWMKSRRVEYHKLPWDVGLSEGRNYLMDQVETEYALLVDDDFVFPPDANIEALVTLLDVADIAAGACTDGTTYTGRLDFEKKDDKRGLVASALTNEHKEYRGIRYQDTDLALNYLAARTETLRALGWDERLKVMEHLDFFIRAKLAGSKVAFTPESRFIHQRERSLEYDQMRSRRYPHVLMGKWNLDYLSLFEKRYDNNVALVKSPIPLPPGIAPEHLAYATALLREKGVYLRRGQKDRAEEVDKELARLAP